MISCKSKNTNTQNGSPRTYNINIIWFFSLLYIYINNIRFQICQQSVKLILVEKCLQLLNERLVFTCSRPSLPFFATSKSSRTDSEASLHLLPWMCFLSVESPACSSCMLVSLDQCLPTCSSVLDL